MTAKATEFDKAYIIHTRPFKETSLILELFTLSAGRVSAVLRGAYRKSKETKGYLQSFIPLSISWCGNSNLKTIKTIEPVLTTQNFSLKGIRLYSGFYINELLLYLLQVEFALPALFKAYEHCILALQKNDDIEFTLRHFERTLLEVLGYGLLLEFEATTGNAIQPNAYYHYDPENGPTYLGVTLPNQEKNIYLGKHLLALQRGEFESNAAKIAAKQIMRQAINRHLAGKKLNSRALFVKVGESDE